MCSTGNGQGLSNKLAFLSMLAGVNSSDIICRYLGYIRTLDTLSDMALMSLPGFKIASFFCRSLKFRGIVVNLTKNSITLKFMTN